MELMMTSVRAFWRILLALAVVYSGLNVRHGSHAHAATTTAPQDQEGDTFLDDEDVNINNKGAGVQFVLDMVSNIGFEECLTTTHKALVMKTITTQLLNDLNNDCKCIETPDNVISRQKLDCATTKVINYSGEILNWGSDTYSIQKLAYFIDSWRALIDIKASDLDLNFFSQVDGFKITFNVTDSQTIIVSEAGSGMSFGNNNIDDITEGSGDFMVTEEIEEKTDKDEENRSGFEVAGLDGISAATAGYRLHYVGLILSVCAALLCGSIQL